MLCRTFHTAQIPTCLHIMPHGELAYWRIGEDCPLSESAKSIGKVLQLIRAGVVILYPYPGCRAHHLYSSGKGLEDIAWTSLWKAHSLELEELLPWSKINNFFVSHKPETSKIRIQGEQRMHCKYILPAPVRALSYSLVFAFYACMSFFFAIIKRVIQGQPSDSVG